MEHLLTITGVDGDQTKLDVDMRNPHYTKLQITNEGQSITLEINTGTLSRLMARFMEMTAPGLFRR